MKCLSNAGLRSSRVILKLHLCVGKCHWITSKEMCLFVTWLLMVNNPFSIYYMNKYPCNISQVLVKVFQGYLKTASKCFINVMGSQVRRCVCSWMSYLGKPPISILLEYIFMSYLSSAGLGSTRVIFKLHLSVLQMFWDHK